MCLEKCFVQANTLNAALKSTTQLPGTLYLKNTFKQHSEACCQAPLSGSSGPSSPDLPNLWQLRIQTCHSIALHRGSPVSQSPYAHDVALQYQELSHTSALSAESMQQRIHTDHF